MRDNQKAISVGFHLTTIRMLRVTLTALILSELCVTCNLFHPFEIHPTQRGGREGHIRGLHHPDLGHSLEERTFADDGGMGIARTHHAELVGCEGEIALGRTIPQPEVGGFVMVRQGEGLGGGQRTPTDDFRSVEGKMDIDVAFVGLEFLFLTGAELGNAKIDEEIVAFNRDATGRHLPEVVRAEIVEQAFHERMNGVGRTRIVNAFDDHDLRNKTWNMGKMNANQACT